MSEIVDLKKQENKKKRKKYFIYFIFIIIIIYILYAVFLLIKSPSETIKVESGTLTEEETSTGYIIRKESVLKGESYKNGLTPIVSEGERAAKGQTIFRYSSSKEEEIKAKIDELNLKIQEAIDKQPNIFPNDIKNLEKQIDEKSNKLEKLTDVQAMEEYKKEIEDIITKKAKISGELSGAGSYIKELTTQKEQYENQLTEDSEYIVANEAGVVSYRVDGLENVLTTTDFSNLTEETLESLGLKTGKIVSTSTEERKNN